MEVMGAHLEFEYDYLKSCNVDRNRHNHQKSHGHAEQDLFKSLLEEIISFTSDQGKIKFLF